MIAEPATSPALFAIDGGLARRSDPVRARVASARQFTNSQLLQAGTGVQPDANSGPFLLGQNRRNGRRVHPGDVIYWAACIGGACLLLLKATT